MATITDTHLTKVLEQFEKHLSLKLHPVGSYYMTEGSENPGTLFGGIWVKILDRVLIGAGSAYAVGAEGGEATHTLTVNEMPTHSHNSETELAGGHNHDVRVYSGNKSDFTAYHNSAARLSPIWQTGSFKTAGSVGGDLAGRTIDNAGDHTHAIGSEGGGLAHNNLPPYRACNIWRRTA